MNESLLNRILKDRKRRTRSLALILCLSMIVSLGTFAGFRQTAQAKVYTKEVLDCPYTYEGAEPVAHVHNDDCYDGQTLVCTLPELEAHTHTDECFTEQRVLVCGLEENPGHQHSEECYDENGELICQIPEGEGAHTHTDDCYTTERILTCDKQELPIHVHDAGCFRTEEISVDEPEENSAPEMPVSDPNADLETMEDWNREFEDFELSGNWAKDLVLVAATQQGRGESQTNFEAVLNDAGDAWVQNGYTRYGAWYGVPYADEWSAMFVSFCLRYAGIPAENVPNNPTAALMAESFSKGELFAGRDYVPAVGDLIFFDTVVNDEITTIDHMGIVYHVDAENGTINTVEGGRSNAVATFGYRMDDEQIVGYGILPQNPDYIYTEEENTDIETTGLIVMTENATDTIDTIVPAVSMPAQSWERTAGGIKVTVDAPEGAFPENTRIAVTPVNGNSLKDTVSDAVSGEVLEVQAVDITFFDANGREIEPAVPIRVVMTPAATENAEEKTSVVHVDIAQQTAELVEQAVGTEADNSEVVFDADSFTIYAIVYTVDTYFRSYTGETYRVMMDFDESAGIPQNAKLEVNEILEENTEYDDLLSQAEDALRENGEIRYIRFFDISIMADGEEVQPSAPVSVKIQLATVPEEAVEADAQVLHFGDQPEVLDAQTAGGQVSFEANGFSVYAVAYTVDFEYEGKTWSFPGQGSYSLNEILEQLEIFGEAADVALERIVDVGGLPNALYLEEKEDGWFLTSEVPFQDTFELKVSVDGKVYRITVTDAASSYSISINTYDYDMSTAKAPDTDYPINGDYYLRIKIQEKDGTDEDGSQLWKDVGWTAIPVGNITESSKTFSFNTFVPLDRNYRTGQQINFDPEQYRVNINDGQSIRLIQPTQSYWENDYQSASNPQAMDDSAPDRYNYFAGAGNESSAWAVNLARAKDIDYHVRLKFEGANSTDDVSAFDGKPGSLYALVAVGHKSKYDGQTTYTYGLVKVTDDMKKSADGSVVLDVPVTEWVDSAGNPVPGEKYTGHELSTNVYLVGVPDSNSNPKPSDFISWGTITDLVLKEGEYVNNYIINHYPVNAGDRIKIDNPDKEHTDNVYDVITLSKDNRTFPSYDLEYIFGDYNLVTVCPNGEGYHLGGKSSDINGEDGTESDGVYTDGDVFLVTHAMGAVLIRGDLIMAGGTGVADSELITKPSVVGGSVLNSGSGTPGNYGYHTGQAVNTRSKNYTPEEYRPDFFIGGDNSVYGQVINGNAITNPGLNANGTTIASPTYIDWDALQASMLNASDTLAAKSTRTITVTQENSSGQNMIEITAGENVTLEYADPNIEANIRIVGDVNSSTGATVINIAGNNVKIPLIQKINDQTATQYLNDPQNNVEGGSNKEDGSGISVVFNMADATKVVMTSADNIGHVLAPRADLRLVGGNYNGCVVANSIYTAAEGHRWPYNGPSGSIVPSREGFKAEKKVNGKVPTAAQQYTFVMEELTGDENGYSWTELQRKQNLGAQVTFDQLTYTEGDEGTHYYRFRELPFEVGEDGIQADTTQYIAKVVVEKVENGDDISYPHTTTLFRVKEGTQEETLVKLADDSTYVVDEAHLVSGESVPSISFNNRTDLTLTKKWQNDNDGGNTEIEYTLYRTTVKPEYVTVKLAYTEAYVDSAGKLQSRPAEKSYQVMKGSQLKALVDHVWWDAYSETEASSRYTVTGPDGWRETNLDSVNTVNIKYHQYSERLVGFTVPADAVDDEYTIQIAAQGLDAYEFLEPVLEIIPPHGDETPSEEPSFWSRSGVIAKSADGQWPTVTLTDLDEYKIDENTGDRTPYYYYVYEKSMNVDSDGTKNDVVRYETSYSVVDKNASEGAALEIDNAIRPSVTWLEINKMWDTKGHESESDDMQIHVVLYRRAKGSDDKPTWFADKTIKKSSGSDIQFQDNDGNSVSRSWTDGWYSLDANYDYFICEDRIGGYSVDDLYNQSYYPTYTQTIDDKSKILSPIETADGMTAYYVPVATENGAQVSIINKDLKVEFKKTWVDADGKTLAPDAEITIGEKNYKLSDLRITIQLKAYADGEPIDQDAFLNRISEQTRALIEKMFEPRTLDGTKDTEIDHTTFFGEEDPRPQAYEDAPWHYVFNKLPAYGVVDHQYVTYTYTVEETAIKDKDGKDLTDYFKPVPTVKANPAEGNTSSMDPTYGQLALTNQLRGLVRVTVQKEWSPAPDEGAVTFELRRYAKKSLGTATVTLRDQYGAPVEGAGFELYKDNEKISDHQTNANGVISVSGLKPGEYYFKQTAVADEEDFKADSLPETAPFTVQDNTLEPQEHSFNLQNTRLNCLGVFTLTLTDDQGSPIQGAQFEMVKEGDPTGTRLSLTTNGDGQIIESGLTPGTYYYKQVSTPDAYQMPTNVNSDTFTVTNQKSEEPQQGAVTMTNSRKPAGTVSVTLTREDNGAAISGAQFAVYRGTATVGEAITDANGQLTISVTGAGAYTLRQLTTDSGLAMAPDQSFVIAENGGTDQKIDFSLTNDEAGGSVTIEIWKGVATGNHSQEQVGTFNNLKPGKTYQIRLGVTENNIINGDKIGITTSFVPGEAPEKYTVIEKENWSNSGSLRYYVMNFTPTQDNTTYRIGVISIHGWGIPTVTAEMLDDPTTVSASSSPRMAKKAFSPLRMANAGVLRAASVPEVQPASPAAAPEGYMDDSSFTRITLTLNQAPWRGSFPGQPAEDANGDPYFYYVVETSHTPDDYFVSSYSGDPLSQSGTITVVNTKGNSDSGSLKITKHVTVNTQTPAESDADLLKLVDGTYSFVIKKDDTPITEGKINGENIVDGKVSITIQNGVSGTVEITDLPEGEYTVTEDIPANRTALLNPENNEISVRVTAGKTGDAVLDAAVASFTNNIYTNDLVLEKQVIGDTDESRKFSFQVEIEIPEGIADTTYKAYVKSANAAGSGDDAGTESAAWTETTAVKVEKGKATVTGIQLAHGEQYRIAGLPDGTQYTITETSVNDFVSSIPADGKTGTITANKDGDSRTESKWIRETVTNTELKSFEFNKIWLAANASMTDFTTEDYTAWNNDATIEVTIGRKVDGVKDETFSLAYSIDAASEKIVPIKINGSDPTDSDKAAYALTRTTDGKISNFKMGKVLTPANAEGKPYEYFVEEKTMNDYMTKYGKLNDSQKVEYNPSYSDANDKGYILNQPTGGYELPQTGGIGTTLFTALGGLMTATAGAILTIRRKRKTAES